MNESSRQIREALYGAASEIGDRETLGRFLAVIAQGDESHAGWLRGILEGQDDADRFIRGIEQARQIAVLETGEELMEQTADVCPDELPQPVTEDLIGKKIGRYQLRERIGEGGCGVVYLAEQTEPVQRQVALKVIRLGMDTERVIARFEAERQSLALMDHPNIARVLDAGATETGRPYFVMERVLGSRITAYCDENRLDIRSRIELFIAACGGIQHAHQKGILHRDIKPSNILVTLTDGRPSPKVIDFGIAKAIGGDAPGGTALTVHEVFAGTPAYMSPEQADLRGRDVDTRSDVYGLGVLLYELLTGRTPFDSAELAAAGLRGMRRIIVEEDPPAPSLKVTSLSSGERASTAAARRLDPARLPAALRGDLDSVVMKAIEKERHRRYETVNGLMMDLHRYLACQPVLARPQGSFYLLGKFIRRNRLAVGAAAAVATSACLGLGVASVSYLRERASKEEQARLRKIAERAHLSERAQLAEAREWENMAQISMLLGEGRISAADERLRGTPLASMKITPQSAGVLRSLGSWNAVNGRWLEAADSFNLLMRANEDEMDTEPLSTDILMTGAALVEQGNVADYQRFREWTLRHFSHQANELVAERVLQATLLTPASESFLLQLIPFREKLERSELDPCRLKPGWSSEAAVWRAWALAMHDYRAGRHESAREWIEKAFAISARPRFMPVLLHSVRAMTEHQLGNPDAAMVSLRHAREVAGDTLTTELPAAREPFGKLQGCWWDWIATRALYREAAVLIEGTSP